MDDMLEGLPEGARDRLREADVPAWLDPMLAALTDDRFSRQDWIYERKLDGERCLTFRDGGEPRLLSRNRQSLNAQYPELVEALAGQERDHFVLDGEVVAFSGGLSSFSRLQARMHVEDPKEARESDVAVYYYIFDLLHIGEYDVTHVPLRERKSLLKRALRFRDPLRLTPHRNQYGEAYFHEACRKGWEGIIAKDATAAYVHGRSRKWLKFKCVAQQELVIGGYTDPKGSRTAFGALLLGYYDGDRLRYAGKVGTGFDDETLKRLGGRLEDMERTEPPFDGDDLPDGGVHWVEPRLVAEIGFEEWTDNGRLRQPRYLGLRTDKSPEDVVREEPED